MDRFDAGFAKREACVVEEDGWMPEGGGHFVVEAFGLGGGRLVGKEVSCGMVWGF